MGFDNTGKFEYKNWLEYTNNLYKQIGIKNLDKYLSLAAEQGFPLSSISTKF